MLGAKSEAAMEYVLCDETRATYEKYSQRYHFDKLVEKLCERKFLMFLSKPHTRSIHVSTFMAPLQLAKLINTSKASSRTYKLSQRIKEASASLI